MKRYDDIAAVILAGGQSKRMGSNKALLRIDEVTFIARIINTLRERFSEIIISANDPHEYLVFKRPVLPDTFKNYGPLAGIHAALNSISSEYVFTTSCDVPFITTEIVDAIIEKRDLDTVLIADDGTRTHPLIGLYPKAVFTAIDRYLREDKRSVHHFLTTVKLVKVDVSKYSNSLRNINTPEDYEREIR